jgi:hypothetical protein
LLRSPLWTPSLRHRTAWGNLLTNTSVATVASTPTESQCKHSVPLMPASCRGSEPLCSSLGSVEQEKPFSVCSPVPLNGNQLEEDRVHAEMSSSQSQGGPWQRPASSPCCLDCSRDHSNEGRPPPSLRGQSLHTPNSKVGDARNSVWPQLRAQF